jgi:hypothetical protein
MGQARFASANGEILSQNPETARDLSKFFAQNRG